MFGKKLKEIRKSLSYTQDEMSVALAIPVRTYSSYERDENNPPYSILEILCSKYSVNLNWFIANIGDVFNESSEQNEQLENLVEQIVDKKMKERGL